VLSWNRFVAWLSEIETAQGAADYIVRDIDEIRTLRLRLVPDRIGTAIDVQSWERNLVFAAEDG